jgi:drug/metabolite transporter (DMT)-like permease
MNILLFVLVACFWGGSFIAIKPLVELIPPVMAATLRIGIAILFLMLLFPLMKIPLSVPKSIRWRVWITGVFAFALPMALLFWGERSINPGLAGVLNGTVPLFVFIFGALFTPGVEVINRRKLIGLFLGMSGVIIIFLPTETAPLVGASMWGGLAVLFMAISYAVSVLLNRNIFTQRPDVHPFSNLFQQLLFAFVLLLILSLLLEGWPDQSLVYFSTQVWLPILYLAIGSTSIAFVIFYKLIKDWGSVRASTVTYIVPAAALIFDFILNGHRPSLNEIFGIVIVTVGVVMLNFFI